MAGLVPAIPMMEAPRLVDRDRRDKPGDDVPTRSISPDQLKVSGSTFAFLKESPPERFQF
jgi:hypothetical protein